jgi:hypothetical protein
MTLYPAYSVGAESTTACCPQLCSSGFDLARRTSNSQFPRCINRCFLANPIMHTLAKIIGSTLRRFFPKRVTFEDGSYVECLNREAIVYRDPRGRRMELPWMFQRGRARGRTLRFMDIDHWDTAHDTELLSPDERNEIRSKVVEYCRQRTIPLEIV